MSTDRIAEGYERVRTTLVAALDANQPPADEWHLAAIDAITEIDWIVQRGTHPDDIAHARSALHQLAGLVFTVEQAEAIYLGEATT